MLSLVMVHSVCLWFRLRLSLSVDKTVTELPFVRFGKVG